MARLEDQLEVLCITYNRATDLDRTLGLLAESPLAGCRITVLDNASTDDTPGVSAKHATRFERMHIVRHRKNIGFAANYLRAVELASAPYTWVMCDDDGLDFDRFDDVGAAICSGQYDLVSFGSAGIYRWARDEATTTAELEDRYPGFYFVSSFVPSLIFRTELFDSLAIAQGYSVAGNAFPHFPFVHACVEQARTLYVAREPVVSRNEGQNALTPLRHFMLWVANARWIEDPVHRRKVVFEQFELGHKGYRSRFVKHLAEWIAYERLEYPERLPRELGEILLGLSPDQRRLLALVAPLALLPRPALRAVQHARARWRGTAPAAVPEHLRRDPLRM